MSAKTGKGWCRNTPYVDALEALIMWEDGIGLPGARDTLRAAARAEVAFLESLRPLAAEMDAAEAAEATP